MVKPGFGAQGHNEGGAKPDSEEEPADPTGMPEGIPNGGAITTLGPEDYGDKEKSQNAS